MNKEDMISWLKGRGIEKIEDLTEKQLAVIVMDISGREAISS